MIRAAAVALSAVAPALATWLVAASYIFVALGSLDIDQPWLAWWLYATDQPDAWTLFLLVISGAIPVVVASAVVSAAWRIACTRWLCYRMLAQ